MSVVTLRTAGLVGVLTDAILTAGCDPEVPLLRSVLLDTDRGEVLTYFNGEGGQGESDMDLIPADVLVCTSTNGAGMVGQTHVACTGQLPRPVLVSAPDAKRIAEAFKKPRELAATTQLELQGDSLVVSEDPREVPEGLAVHVPVLDRTEYPRTLPALLQPDPLTPVLDGRGDPVERSYGLGLSGEAFEIVGKVSKRRKMDAAFYAFHQHRGVIVEVGSMWRAVFPPIPLDEDLGQQLGPVVRVFTPRLPTREPVGV